jgi:hypothetical protein
MLMNPVAVENTNVEKITRLRRPIITVTVITVNYCDSADYGDSAPNSN